MIVANDLFERSPSFQQAILLSFYDRYNGGGFEAMPSEDATDPNDSETPNTPEASTSRFGKWKNKVSEVIRNLG